jgi:hypothetical protein
MLGGGGGSGNVAIPPLPYHRGGVPSPRQPAQIKPGQRLPQGLPLHRGGAFLQDFGGDEEGTYEDFFGTEGYGGAASPPARSPVGARKPMSTPATSMTSTAVRRRLWT